MKYNLVAKFSDFDPEKPTVQIYGDPDALRWLAGLLVMLADYDQSGGFPPDEGRVDHLRPTPRPSGHGNLHPASLQLDIGRLDRRSDMGFDWFLDQDEMEQSDAPKAPINGLNDGDSTPAIG
jgi:hypothetical protein